MRQNAESAQVSRWMVLPSWVGHALGGLVVGAVLGYLALPYLLSLRLAERIGIRLEAGEHFWVAPLLGGAIGMLAGLVSGAIAQQRAGARRSALAQSAGQLGARFSPTAESELQASLQQAFPNLSIHLENILRKDLVDVRLILGEATISRRAGSYGHTSSKSSTQTAAYFEAREGTFPRFSVYPATRMLRMLSGAAGLQGLRFADQPEFAQHYLVLATEPLGAQALLIAEARTWLVAHPQLHVESGESGVLVYRAGEMLDGAELEQFAGEAAALFRLFEQARRAAQSNPVKPSAVDEARAFAAQMPASVARSIEKELQARLVTREQVDAFVRQPAPRRIPSNIAQQYRGPLVIVLVGAGFVSIAGFLLLPFSAKGEWTPIIFLSLFVLAGAAMVFFGGRSWWRQRGLLRRGEVAAARIESVEDTGWSDDVRGQAHNLSARYQVGGQWRQGRGKVWGRAARRAKNLAAQGKAAPILYDPAHPERIVLIDGLVNPLED